MTPFSEARSIVLSAVGPLKTEEVPIGLLYGRVFARDLVCPFDVPHFDNSQVDGYAVRAEDEGPRQVVGISAAGDGFKGSVGKCQAARIYTGAPIPDGADAVVMQEDVRVEGDRLFFKEPVRVGDFIRRRGEEITEGTRFATRGLVASPPLIGFAASFGLDRIECYRLPRVTIVATGDELVFPGSPLDAGQVYVSNPLALEAALKGLGIDEIDLRLVGDDATETRTAFKEALYISDVVVAVGGISVGDRDLVRPTLNALGVEELLWRVDMKPGKPFYFGKSAPHPQPLSPGKERGVLVFGLPGNPVSALVTFYTLVRPALIKLLGIEKVTEESKARLGKAIVRKDTRYEFVRAALQDGIAIPAEAQGSHMQTGLVFADALIHLPSGQSRFEEGEEVTVTELRWSF